MSSLFMSQGYYPSDDDYYVILGVDFKASQEDISSAYKRLAKIYHPDKNNQDDRSRKEAQVIFEKIKIAYEVLGDPRKRNIYDALGPDGLKVDGWALTNKLMTADDIREEFLRLQKRQEEFKVSVIAKPTASFTLSLDATDIFDKRIEDDPYDSEDDDYDQDVVSIVNLIPVIQIASMSGTLGVDHHIAKNHDLGINAGLNVKNGTGDGIVGLNYRYRYSPETKYDILYRFGNGPILSCGMNYQIDKRTSINTRGILVYSSGMIKPGLKITLAHLIRDYLTGKVVYKEGIDPSVTTSLIYINQKLLIELTTSYKLNRRQQRVNMELGYHFNNKNSKLSVGVGLTDDGGVEVEYGCETRVLEINSIGASLAFSLPDGVTLKIRYSRANQEINIPIYLSDELHSAPMFYGTMVPLVAFYLWDRVYLRHQKSVS